MTRPLAETEVQDPSLAPAAPVADPKAPEETEAERRGDMEERPHTGGAKPPEDGLCRNCRMRRRLNRFKLCYPCWVEAEITDREKKAGREWKAGDPHPAWCNCEGLGEHKNADGTARGFN